MKKIKIVLLVIIVSNFNILKAQTNEFSCELKNTKTILSSKDGVQYVFESPTGNYLCYSSKDLNKVYLKKLGSKKTKDILIFSGSNCGYFPSWSKQGNRIYMRNKVKENKQRTVQTIVYNISTKKVSESSSIVPQSINGTLINDEKTEEHDYVYIDDKLQLIRYNSTLKQSQVLEKDKSCYQPIISPDKKKVAVHIGSDVWIYDIEGKKTPINLGLGLITSWSPNSIYLLGFIDESLDGHDVSNSDLYLYNIQSVTKLKITNTKNIFEMNPSWSSNGKHIYYIDSNTNNILKSDITIK